MWETVADNALRPRLNPTGRSGGQRPYGRLLEASIVLVHVGDDPDQDLVVDVIVPDVLGFG